MTDPEVRRAVLKAREAVRHARDVADDHDNRWAAGSLSAVLRTLDERHVFLDRLPADPE